MYRLKFILFAILIAFLATDGMAMGPEETLLNRAKKLSISTPAEDGTTVDKLLADLPAKRVETLAKVGSLKFGPEKKTLQALVDERMAAHATGDHAKFGLRGREENIGAFHKALDDAYHTAASSAPKNDAASRFTNDILGLYSDYIIDGGSAIDVDRVSADLPSGLKLIVAHLGSLGQYISRLEGEKVRLEKEIAQQEAMRGRKGFPKGSSATVDGEDGMGLFD